MTTPSPTQVQYRLIHDIALLAGEIMLQNGAETYRVEDTITRILSISGFARTEAFVTITGIFVTLEDPALDQPLTTVRRVYTHTTNLNKISVANDISRKLVSGALSLEEAKTALAGLKSLSAYPWPLLLLTYSLVCGFFTILFNGSPRDFASSCVTGVLLGLLVLALGHLKIPRFMKDFASSVLIGFSGVLLVYPLGLGEYLDPIIIGALMPLVPGIAITNAVRDTLNGDYLSGVAQGVEAALTAVSIAAGVSLILHFYAFTPLSPMAPAEVVHWFSFGWEWPVSPDILFQTVCAFGASLGFSILFNASRTHLICCGIAGACSWFLYAVMLQQGFSPLMANFIAVLGLSILTGHLARLKKAPITVFLAPGIIPLVPGAGMYRTMFYIFGGEYARGGRIFIETMEIAAILAVGIAIHYSFGQIWRQIRRRSTK